MSLLRRSLSIPTESPTWADVSRGRVISGRSSAKMARKHSIVWAATRLRADLVSSLPIDVFRRSAGIQIEVPRPAVMVAPAEHAAGQPMLWSEWIYASQMSLDSLGNAFGIVRQWSEASRPLVIDLVPDDEVTVEIDRRGKVKAYRFFGEVVDPRHVWHERQHVVAGCPIGLSPIAHAAMQLSIAAGAESFARDWFGNGAVPSAILKNEERTIDKTMADKIKERFLYSVAVGEPFVTGKDWSYSPIAAKAAESGFIDQQRYTDLDLCRFFGVPGTTVDAAQSGSSITYANLTQDQLSLLVRHIGPVLKRREDAWTRHLVASTNFVKFNQNAFLRMDPETRARVTGQQVKDRVLSPSEARALEDRQPFTDADYAEFDRLFGNPNKPPTQGSAT